MSVLWPDAVSEMQGLVAQDVSNNAWSSAKLMCEGCVAFALAWEAENSKIGSASCQDVANKCQRFAVALILDEFVLTPGTNLKITKHPVGKFLEPAGRKQPGESDQTHEQN